MIRELIPFRVTREEASTVYAALGFMKRFLVITFEENGKTPRDEVFAAMYRDMKERVDEVSRLEAILADEVGLSADRRRACSELCDSLLEDFIEAVRRGIVRKKRGPRLP